jgi:hypothetical protein
MRQQVGRAVVGEYVLISSQDFTTIGIFELVASNIRN